MVKYEYKYIKDLEKTTVMDTFQSGFHRLHPQKPLYLKSHDILMAADSGDYPVLSLDLSSAFDTVHHMINRLQELFRITGVILKWFTSHLSERYLTVSVNGVMSDSVGYLRDLFFVQFSFCSTCFLFAKLLDVTIIFLIIYMLITSRYIYVFEFLNIRNCLVYKIA